MKSRPITLIEAEKQLKQLAQLWTNPGETKLTNSHTLVMTIHILLDKYEEMVELYHSEKV